jgi:DNA-binding MarR family transcriptional regulator
MEIETIAMEIADGCYALRSRSLARAITRIYDDHLRPHGLTASQLTLLTVLGLGIDRPVDIGRRLNMEKSTVTRSLQLMTDRGWITSEPNGASKRLMLTVAGQDLVAASADAWRAATDKVSERLDHTGLLPSLTAEPAVDSTIEEPT